MRLLENIAEKKANDEDAFSVLSFGAIATAIGFIVVMFATAGHTWAGLLWAMALYSAGLIAGFLFSLSRVEPGNSTAGSAAPARRYVPNTALGDIADWLTKIIVGLSLVELQKIPGKVNLVASRISEVLAPGGKAEAVKSATAIALAMIVFFPIMGFLAAYLSTRLFLNPEIKRREDAMEKAEKAAAILHDEVQNAGQPDVVAAATTPPLWTRSSNVDPLSTASSSTLVIARALHAIISAAGVRTPQSNDPSKMLTVLQNTVSMRGRQSNALRMVTDALSGLTDSAPGASVLVQQVQDTLLELARRKGNERVFDTLVASANKNGKKVEMGAKRGDPEVSIELIVDEAFAFVTGTAIVEADLASYAARFTEYAAALKSGPQPVMALNDPYQLVATVDEDFPALLFRIDGLTPNEAGRKALPWLTAASPSSSSG
jgi:hypothetical protein